MLETDEKLIETYLKGFKEKKAGIFQEDEYDSVLQQVSYNLGRTHAMQDKNIQDEKNILNSIYSLYEKFNHTPL